MQDSSQEAEQIWVVEQIWNCCDVSFSSIFDASNFTFVMLVNHSILLAMMLLREDIFILCNLCISNETYKFLKS